MRKRTVSLGLLFVLALFFAFPISSQAQELKQGMTQGEFAQWLIKAIDAQSKLPPAYGAEEAISFLTQLGSIPEGGWQKNQEMTTQALASLLEKPEEGANLSWDDLVAKVRDHIQQIFDKKKLGVFRVFSTTGSQPA